MLDKLKQNETLTAYFERVRSFVLGLRDVRRVSVAAFVVLIILVTWSGAKAIQTNYLLQKQVYELAKSNEVKSLENKNLELSNHYYETSQYLEVAARQNLGLAAPGETVLLVPKDVALSHTVAMPSDTKKDSVESKLPFWQKNFRDWVNFFLHRQS